MTTEEIKKEIIRLGGTPDPNSDLALEDQLLACQCVWNTPEMLEIRQKENGLKEKKLVSNKQRIINKENTTTNDSVLNVNTLGKHRVNTALTQSKQQCELIKNTVRKQHAIAQLKKCTYRTSPKTVAILLKELFCEYESKEGHWLFIAVNYPPRRINQVIQQMINKKKSGYPIPKPPAFFTYLIKKRKERKLLRVNNNK